MKFIEFSTSFEKKCFFKEFRDEFKRIDEETLERLFHCIKKDFNNEEGQLYHFGKFLFDLLYHKWFGYLNSELIYITTKILVLTGLNKEARKISRGYTYHAGCCAWRLGSYYRTKSEISENKEISELQEEIDQHLKSINSKDDLIIVDLLTWKLAFLPSDLCFDFYKENKSYFTKIYSYIILVERLINQDIAKANLMMKEINYFTTLTGFEEILVNNKKAVLFQLQGDQKQAINFLEQAIEKADKLGDYFNESKLTFNQASSYFLIGDYELSIYSYQKAESIYKFLGDDIGVGKCYNGLSAVYNVFGEFSMAEKYIVLAEQIFYNHPDKIMKEGLKYKHASILFLQGLYKKSLSLLNTFNVKEQSILNFEVQLLKLTTYFELYNVINESEIAFLLKMADSLNYTLGKANLIYHYGRMNILQGNLVFGKSKIDESYSIFQKISNTRGIVKTLILNSLFELITGNITSAESYCETALTQSKNYHLFTEEIESSLIFSTIFFLTDNKYKAQNLIDSVLFLLESRNMKNNYYLQALFTKCTFELHKFSFENGINYIFRNSLIEFMKITKNSGSLYWINQSKLLEALEFINSENYMNSYSIALEVLQYSENYEMKFQAHKILINSLIASLLDENINKNEKRIQMVKEEIDIELEKMYKMHIKEDLIIKKIEYQLLILSYWSVIGNQKGVESRIEDLKEIITKNHVYHYSHELQKYEFFDQSKLEDLVQPEFQIATLFI